MWTGDKVSISPTDSVIKKDIRASARCCASDSLETIICRDATDTVLSGCDEDTHRTAGSGGVGVTACGDTRAMVENKQPWKKREKGSSSSETRRKSGAG